MRKERCCRGQQRAEKDGSKNEKDGRKEVLDASPRESNGMKLCPSRSLLKSAKRRRKDDRKEELDDLQPS